MHTAPLTTRLTETDVLAALRDCYDSAISLNIVDLGIVHSITIAPDPKAPGAGIPGVPTRHRVHVALIVAQIVDPESDAAPLAAQIQNRLAAFETISQTEITFLTEPAWTPDRITPEGRARLGTHLTTRKSAHGLVQIKT